MSHANTKGKRKVPASSVADKETKQKKTSKIQASAADIEEPESKKAPAAAADLSDSDSDYDGDSDNDIARDAKKRGPDRFVGHTIHDPMFVLGRPGEPGLDVKGGKVFRDGKLLKHVTAVPDKVHILIAEATSPPFELYSDVRDNKAIELALNLDQRLVTLTESL